MRYSLVALLVEAEAKDQEPCIGRQRRAGTGGFETRPYIGWRVSAALGPGMCPVSLPGKPFDGSQDGNCRNGCRQSKSRGGQEARLE